MEVLRTATHTSHIRSLDSINELIASIARKLSSIPGTLVLVSWYKMFGVITVARLWMSILLPDSSSTWENEAAQVKNEKRISKQSLWDFGSRQHVRWRI